MPRPYQTPSATLRVSGELYETLRTIAEQRDCTLSQAMDFLLDRQRDKPEPKAKAKPEPKAKAKAKAKKKVNPEPEVEEAGLSHDCFICGEPDCKLLAGFDGKSQPLCRQHYNDYFDPKSDVYRGKRS